jgi:hypothetical protein
MTFPVMKAMLPVTSYERFKRLEHSVEVKKWRPVSAVDAESRSLDTSVCLLHISMDCC